MKSSVLENTEQNKFIKETRHNCINNPTYPKILDFFPPFFLNSILQKLLLTPLYVVTMLFILAENVCCRFLDRINVQVIFTVYVVIVVIIIHTLFVSNLLWLFFQRWCLSTIVIFNLAKKKEKLNDLYVSINKWLQWIMKNGLTQNECRRIHVWHSYVCAS